MRIGIIKTNQEGLDGQGYVILARAELRIIDRNGELVEAITKPLNNLVFADSDRMDLKWELRGQKYSPPRSRLSRWLRRPRSV
jgi:hypothetical protein